MPEAIAAIFLIGPRCVGKTTVAQVLARKYACPMLDTDALVIEKYRRSITDIVQTEG